jgi:hypothetical protein
MVEVDIVRFICRTENGSVIVYVDLDDKIVFSETYPNDFCTLNVKNFRKSLTRLLRKRSSSFSEM